MHAITISLKMYQIESIYLRSVWTLNVPVIGFVLDIPVRIWLMPACICYQWVGVSLTLRALTNVPMSLAKAGEEWILFFNVHVCKLCANTSLRMILTNRAKFSKTSFYIIFIVWYAISTQSASYVGIGGVQPIHKLCGTIVLCAGVSLATCAVATNINSQYALYVTVQYNALTLVSTALVTFE